MAQERFRVGAVDVLQGSFWPDLHVRCPPSRNS
jgi:hypothetical protein